MSHKGRNTLERLMKLVLSILLLSTMGLKHASAQHSIQIELISATTTLNPQPVAVKEAPPSGGGIVFSGEWESVAESKNIAPKMRSLRWKGKMAFGLLPSNSTFVIIGMRLTTETDCVLEDSDFVLVGTDGTQYYGVFWNNKVPRAWTVTGIGRAGGTKWRERMLFVVDKASLGEMKLQFRGQSVSEVNLTGTQGTPTKKTRKA